MDRLSNKLPDESTQPHEPNRKWYHFQSLTPTCAILHGSFAMTSRHFKFGSRGHQASPCCVIAIIISNLIPPKQLTTSDIDQILNHGDKLFRLSLTKNRLKNNIYMTPSMIYPEFFIDDYKCQISSKPSVIFGNLFTSTINSPNFSEGLIRFFKIYNSGIVTSQGTSVAIWRNLTANFFYFDPSPCLENGLKSLENDGTACLVRFKHLNDMKELFLKNLNQRTDSRYCIDAIVVVKRTLIDRNKFIGPCPITKITKLRSTNPLEFEEKSLDCTTSVSQKVTNSLRPLINQDPIKITISNYKLDEKFATEPLINQYDAYYMEINIPSIFKELPGNLAVLHGWTHEASDGYKAKGLQNVANCVTAIAVKKIHPVRTWLRSTIDEILTLGDSLYLEVKSANSTIKSVRAVDLNDTIIIIDGKKLFIDVDLITIVGTLSSKLPDVLNLRQAIEEFFLVNQNGVIECSSMAAGIWAENDGFYLFDPKQCGPDGVRIVDDKTKARGKGKKKDLGPDTKKIEGQSCVLRCPDVNSLVGHFLKNVESNKKNDRFIIHHVNVMTDIPGTRPWYDFEPGEAGKTWMLQGILSNDSEEFEEESRGNQGIAMPISALIKASQVPPNLWTSEIVDDAIKEGDDFYNYCISTETEDEPQLTLSNVKNHFYSKNRKIKFNIEECSVVGDISATSDAQQSNLEAGLENFFKDHQFGILEINDLAVGIWKFEEEQKVKGKSIKEVIKEIAYYCFDPNPQNKLGDINPEDERDPAACVIRSLNPSELARIIKSHVDTDSEKQEFFIHSIKVESISEVMTPEELEFDKQTPTKPELNAYSELNDNGAFLNGSFDQSNSQNFKERTKDKQQAATALVTLAMSKLYNPHLWYREVVDDILKFGDKITAENLKNLPEDEEEDETTEHRDFLIPSEIDEIFKIGVNNVTITIEEGLSAPAAEIENSLVEFFAENSLGIFRQDNVILPIWKEGNIYFTLNPRGSQENNKVATVFWFTNIPSLTTKIREFIYKPGEQITIDLVTLENEYETRVAQGQRTLKTISTEELWHNFPKKSQGVYELQGTLSMMDERFPEANRGNQSAAVAVMAVIFSKAYESRLWTSEILDQVIIIGDKLYMKSVARLGENISPRVNEILTEFFLSDRRLQLNIEDCVEAGEIQGYPPTVQDLQTGLENFFTHHISGVITLINFNIATWQDHDHYYCLILDSPPHLMRFNSLELFSQHIRNVYSNGDFEIHGVSVINCQTVPTWKLDPSAAIRPSNLPSLNAFKQLPGSARAILRSGIHQGSEIFSDSIKNRQGAANCLVALGMSLIKNPIMWTKKTLDDILVIGCGVHKISQKSQTRDKLKPQHVTRIFQIGVNIITADVEPGTISGQVAIPPPEPEIKGKKKAKKVKKPAKSKAKKKKSSREAPPPSPPILLEDALSRFLQNNRAGILTTGRSMVAFWKDQGVYFLFDPRSRDFQGLSDEHGVACVMWFACLEPFYDTIFKNINENEKYGDYEIVRVILRTVNVEPLPNPTGFRGFFECIDAPTTIMGIKNTVTVDLATLGEFTVVNNQVSVLLGNISMNDHGFEIKSRGFQSTAIAAVAIVVGVLHVPSTWTAKLVDCILNNGDILYNDSNRMVRSGPRTLSPSELLTTFIVGDFKVNIAIHKHIIAGILLVPDLLDGLGVFFQNNCAGILHTPNLSIAVMQHYGKFYSFDPREFDKFGRISNDGSASVTKCNTIEQLVKLFVENCNFKAPCVYTLNSVNIIEMHFFSKYK